MTPNSQLHDDVELSNFTEVYIQSSANRLGVIFVQQMAWAPFPSTKPLSGQMVT